MKDEPMTHDGEPGSGAMSQTAITAREYAKQNIEQVKDTQEKFLDAMTQAQKTFFQSSGMVNQEEAEELNNKTLDIIKANIESGFDLATKLVDATDVSEAVELQSEYVRKQLEAYTEQAQELSDMIINNQQKK